MCSGQKCIDVPNLSGDCSANCGDKGVCNSEGHCHCEEGYAPPFCLTPGPGGSVDSNGGGQYPGKYF